MTFVVKWMRVTPVECPTQVATPAPSQVRREFAATQEGSDPKATSAQNGAHTSRRFMDLSVSGVVVVGNWRLVVGMG